MSDHPKTTYCGIEIILNERTEHWHFLLRGKERCSSTLALAKAAIDAPPPANKKPFTRQRAYRKHYALGWGEVEVTSIADSGYASARMFWVTSHDKRREKVTNSDLFAKTKANDAKIYQIEVKRAEIETLQEQIREIEKLVAPFVVADNIE
jgi:hypothetical protein